MPSNVGLVTHQSICLHNAQHAFHHLSQRLHGFTWISKWKAKQSWQVGLWSVIWGKEHQGRCAPGFAP